MTSKTYSIRVNIVTAATHCPWLIDYVFIVIVFCYPIISNACSGKYKKRYQVLPHRLTALFIIAPLWCGSLRFVLSYHHLVTFIVIRRCIYMLATIVYSRFIIIWLSYILRVFTRIYALLMYKCTRKQ